MARSSSYPLTLQLLMILIVGFTFTLSQDHRFRIQVYDDYPEYQEYQDYQFVKAPREEVRHAPVGRAQHEQIDASMVHVPLKEVKKKQQDFSKIPGVAGIDYPLYHQVPPTGFSCAKVPYVPGMYANPETGCQAYHVCHDGREGHQGASFLCSNGTLFNQKEFACDWWYNVNCDEATKLYRLNGDLETNPFVPKERKEAVARERLRIAVF